MHQPQPRYTRWASVATHQRRRRLPHPKACVQTFQYDIAVNQLLEHGLTDLCNRHLDQPQQQTAGLPGASWTGRTRQTRCPRPCRRPRQLPSPGGKRCRRRRPAMSTSTRIAADTRTSTCLAAGPRSSAGRTDFLSDGDFSHPNWQQRRRGLQFSLCCVSALVLWMVLVLMYHDN